MDFWYQNSTKIIFGRNKIDELGPIIKHCGSKVLLVYGQHSAKRSGLHQRLLSRLSSDGLKVVDYGGVKPNPVISHVRKGIELAKAKQIDCVLAAGGGSVIDSAKAIAFGAKADSDVWSFFQKRIKPTAALPIFTALTIPGTSSEANTGTVITNEEEQRKLSVSSPCLAPTASILDPTLTLSVSKEYTAYSLADAFSHVMEGYFNAENMTLTVKDHLAEAVFKSILEVSKELISDLDNYSLRADSMWACYLANNGILNAGRSKINWEIHCLAHALEEMFDLPHGAAISVVIPAWMESRQSEKLEKFTQFAIKVMEIKGFDDLSKVSQLGTQALRAWLAYLGNPISLTGLGMETSIIPDIVNKITDYVSDSGLSGMTPEKIKIIVKLMFQNS